MFVGSEIGAEIYLHTLKIMDTYCPKNYIARTGSSSHSNSEEKLPEQCKEYRVTLHRRCCSAGEVCGVVQ